MANNAVRFVYLSAGHPMPVPSDPNAIYFIEEAQQLWVGDKLIADHIDPPDIPAYLEPYEVKRIVVNGEGSIVVNTEFNSATGVITVTKGNPPPIAIAPAGDVPDVEPGAGTSVTVVTDLSVDGHTIHPSKARVLFDDYMKANNGVATAAEVTLKHDPVADMDAVTKQYVDEKVKGVTGAMHYLGVSSTPITNGGREHPKIKGKEYDTETLHAGDFVLYSPNQDGNYTEFVWQIDDEGTGSWTSLGDEGSYALKGTEIVAGDGLTGGGTLASDVTISLAPVEGGAKEYKGTKDTEFISSVTRDEFGNITDAGVTDIQPIVDDAVDSAVSGIKTEILNEANAYTDEKISEIVIPSSIDVVILGTGNALTDATWDDETHTLTITKGTVEGEETDWDVVVP